jgi:hypothetical protein
MIFGFIWLTDVGFEIKVMQALTFKKFFSKDHLEEAWWH